MTTYIYRNGEIVEKSEAERRDYGPAIISDHQEALKHHGTGKITDSKSEFRKMTRACGAIEIGNELPKPRQPVRLDKRERKEAIQKAIFDLRNK